MSSKASALPEGYTPRIHRAEVTAVRRVTPGMIRITLGGADMADYPTTGSGDEYVRLFFPVDGEDDVRMPFVTDRGWDYPEGVAPGPMRTYTIRDHRPGEVDIDFVVHDGGVAAAWAEQAEPGRRIALNPPGPMYEMPSDASRQILLTDEPGLPAALRIAELTAHALPTTIVAELRDASHRQEASVPGVEHIWIEGTGNGHTPSQLARTLRRLAPDGSTYVWLSSETRVIREARKHLRHDLGLPKDRYLCMGYWIERAEAWRARYDELGPDFTARVSALYDEDRDLEEIVDDVQELYESVGL